MTTQHMQEAAPLARTDGPHETSGGKASSSIELGPQQRDAARVVKNWRANPCGRVCRLFGYAGTGKAASVLLRKGVPATTIHSAIYRPQDRPDLHALLDRLRLDLAAADIERRGVIEWQIAEAERELRGARFELNPDSEWALADLIVLDEVSMVDEQMADDIESFGVPVLVLGDPEQLPPINGAGRYTGDGVVPDVLLTEVHRQAADSPVLALATGIRQQGHQWAAARYDLGAALAADQVLCWKNATRWQLVAALRSARGLPHGVPVAGDRIMTLRNNRDLGVFNGEQFVVEHVVPDGDGWKLSVVDDIGYRRTLHTFAEGFVGLTGEKELSGRHGVHRASRAVATFADAITVHKAQGSEWDSVYVIDESPGLYGMTLSQTGDPAAADRAVRRWAYTAATRAAEVVTFVRHPAAVR